MSTVILVMLAVGEKVSSELERDITARWEDVLVLIFLVDTVSLSIL